MIADLKPYAEYKKSGLQGLGQKEDPRRAPCLCEGPPK